jgi:predicted permease
MTLPKRLEALLVDVRFAFRYFARHKATVAIIVAVLSLGVGANTMIFTMFRSEFLRPPAGVPDDPAHARFFLQARQTQTGKWEPALFTHAELATIAARRDVLSAVTGWAVDEVVLDGQASDSANAWAVDAHFVTPNFFRTVGLPLAAGQDLLPHEDAADFSAIMGHAIAVRLYGSAAAAVGRRILVNEVPVRVIGVAAPRFEGPIRGDDAMLWMPASARPDILRVDRRVLEQLRSLSILGRLAPGATHEQATAFTQHAVTASLPDSAARVGMARIAHVQPMTAAPPGEAGQEIVIAITVLSTIGLLILLVGWMNVSSLMVAAAVARRHEIAVRLSLGASRLRLLRQLVTESTLLAIMGGSVGLTLSWWAMTALAKSSGDGVEPVDVMPDAGTLAFVVLISVGAGIVFGLSPALHATRGRVANALRDSGSATSGRSRLQRIFVGAQIMLSQPLLLILGLLFSLVVSDYQPHSAEMSRRVIKVGLRPLAQTGAASQRVEAVDALVPRIAARPEVEGAVQDATGFDIRAITVLDRDASVRPGAARPDSAPTIVSLEGAAPGWFAVVEVPIIMGRDVQLADTAGADRNIVIGSDLAQALWRGENPIGRRLASPPIPGLNTDSATMTVVGVYDASRALPEMTWGGASAAGDQHPRLYTAWGKAWRRDQLLVRTRGPAAPYLTELQRVLRAEAPSLPVTFTKTLEQLDAEAFREMTRASLLAGAGGTLALLLAALGLYGVVSLAVQQRTREIGIRIAIGARPRSVARMFLASGVRVSAIAMLLGLPLSVAGVKVGMSRGLIHEADVSLYAISACIAAILLAVASAATWVPARRAARVDPVRSLRAE